MSVLWGGFLFNIPHRIPCQENRKEKKEDGNKREANRRVQAVKVTLALLGGITIRIRKSEEKKKKNGRKNGKERVKK